ncbi:hypothetical protein GLOIN_2v1586633 [Rhizophagus irregularis DAOM 181602=DAOM 197198]|nr:hypothetical protein GLOIN_2v1586633 [Rhizophagus irregularis DAOM 181602=DAOM 197198]POG73452.1 hypothetical protein GLOIN_2v1586633 [Rhizophagus irregularis DAOM 181602=DAOM 197198]|eukprot:XP_025180318.1 hypothetical protein GLOIN_2v1586633 [Rhizophagus irregularis DAOM 181602=DAOM 197198]
MEQNFNLIYQTSFENNSFLELQKYCTDLMSKYPDKILKSLDFSSVPEKILISLIQSDNLQMSEIQVWENVLKWGLVQNPGLSSNPSNYSKDDFNSLKNTLQSCIPFIRFYNLTSQEFSDHILPYKEVLPEELYMDLLKTFLSLNPNSKPGHKSNPRMTKEITPPPPPRSSYSYSKNTFDDLDKQPQLSSSSSNYKGDLIDFSASTLFNSNPIHKSNPRMTKEITPPSPLKPSVSYFNEPPRLSSNPFETFLSLNSLNTNSKPSHKSDSRMTKEIPPPPPPPPFFNPSYLYHKSNPRMTPPRPITPSYFNDLHKLPRLSSISSNKNGDLSSASTYQELTPWKGTQNIQRSLPVKLDQEFSEEYQETLIRLKDMGFNNEEENLKALKEFNGDLERVIENLISKM